MSIEQNKAVVRRFITEVLVGGDVDLVDDLLSADYVNRGMGDMDRAAFKAWLSEASVGSAGRMEIDDLVAEGDAVVARFTMAVTLPTGEDARPGASRTTVSPTAGSWRTTPSPRPISHRCSPTRCRHPPPDEEATTKPRLGRRGLEVGSSFLRAMGRRDDVMVCGCGPTSMRARSRRSQPVAYFSRPADASSSGAMATR